MRRHLFYGMAGIFSCVCFGMGGETALASEDLAGQSAAAGQLSICVEESSLYSDVLLPVIERFQEQFPEVEVDIRQIPPIYQDSDIAVREAEVKQIKTEMMSGGGPDLFVQFVGTQMEYNGLVSLFPDLEKSGRAGVFADLGEMIEADGTIDMNDFYPFVQEAGTMGERFVVFPLSFYDNALNVTTEANLEASGIDLKTANSSAEAYASELERCLPKEQRFDAAGVGYDNLSYGLLDYDTGEVHLGEKEEFYYSWGLERREDERWTENYDTKLQRQLTGIVSGEIPMVTKALNPASAGALAFAEYMAAEGAEAVFWMTPDEKGGCSPVDIGSFAAVNANSPNKGNAMEFLKILVSEEMQSGGYYPGNYYMPVRRGENVLRSVYQVRRNRESILDSLPRGELSEASWKSLMEQLDRIATGRLMMSQIYFLPMDGDHIFNDYLTEYWNGEITYEELSDIAKEGLEFYWEE